MLGHSHQVYNQIGDYVVLFIILSILFCFSFGFIICQNHDIYLLEEDKNYMGFIVFHFVFDVNCLFAGQLHPATQ